MSRKVITDAFICEAANVLGDEKQGLSGSKICTLLVPYATQYNINIPHTTPPLKKKDGTPVNKRTALKENLQCF